MNKPPLRDKKELLMQKAINQAKVALRLGEVPIGAIVVDKEGVVIGRGYNRMELGGCQLGHAEARAIAQACKKIGDWRLNGCSIYVSLEPCLMCIGLIQLSRVESVIFGAPSPLFGCGLSKEAPVPSYAKHLRITQGILASECASLLQDFFRQARKKEKKG